MILLTFTRILADLAYGIILELDFFFLKMIC